jgi:hypothetical protein
MKKTEDLKNNGLSGTVLLSIKVESRVQCVNKT